jgi:hypothetical protein
VGGFRIFRYNPQLEKVKIMFSANVKRMFLGSLIGSLIGSVLMLEQVAMPRSAIAQPTPVSVIAAPTVLPATVVKAVQQSASQSFGVPVGQLQVMGALQRMWPDGCLGLVPLGVLCTQQIVPGWLVPVTDGIQTWTYRTDATGKVVKLEDPDKARLPVTIAQKLVQRVARENRIAVSQLRVTEVRSRVFDGCLGIYRPKQVCTEIGIPGWQAIVKSPQQSWVYHLNDSAARIARNTAASGAGRDLQVTFDGFAEERPPIDAAIVFQQTVSGGFVPQMRQTVLTVDGKVTVYSSSPLEKMGPKVIKTLSPEQVTAFKRTLENQRYPNLNGLNYLTRSIADAPITSFESQSGVVQYINFEPNALPRSLRQVIRVWDELIKVNNPI